MLVQLQWTEGEIENHDEGDRVPEVSMESLSLRIGISLG